MKTILFAGFGDLARHTLRQLSLVLTEPVRFVIACRQPQDVLPFVNMLRFASLQLDRFHVFDCIAFDANQPEVAAETLAAVKPDIVYSTMTRQAWWVVFDRLSGDVANRMKQAQLGPWLPVHLAPVLHLMRAVRLSGIDTRVINAAFPDAVNPALAGIGLAPLCGIGNVANNVPALRTVAAAKLEVPVTVVKIRFVAAHFVSHQISRAGDSGGAPFLLSVEAAGRDVTSRFAPGELFADLPRGYPRQGGKAGQTMTAASAVSLLKALAIGTDDGNLHAPGPYGHPGGYPVRVRNGRLDLDLADGTGLAEAVRINATGMQRDGIQKIAAGRVWFRAAEMDVLDDMLGYRCDSMAVDDAPALADELTAKFAAFSRSGV